MALWFIWNGRLHYRKWFISTNGISSYSEDMNKLEPKKWPRVPSFAKMKLTREMLILGKLMERQHIEDSKSNVLSRIYKSSAFSWNSLSPVLLLMLCLKTVETRTACAWEAEDAWTDHPFTATECLPTSLSATRGPQPHSLMCLQPRHPVLWSQQISLLSKGHTSEKNSKLSRSLILKTQLSLLSHANIYQKSSEEINPWTSNTKIPLLLQKERECFIW